MSGVILNSLSTQDRRRAFSRKLFIANLQKLDTGEYADITNYVTRLSVSYTMDMASSISFDIIDPDLNMSKNNYFQIGRDIVYETQTLGKIMGTPTFGSEESKFLNQNPSLIRNVRQIFEIASVTVNQGPGGSPSFSVQCYTKAVQQMKRDKNPRAIKGNGSTFIRNAARQYGLVPYVQQTSKSKQITKATGSKQADSLWEVMQRLASDAKFVLFEVDGILVFASEKHLLHRWGISQKFRQITKTNPKTKKVTKTTTAQRWMPLQFPNDGPLYNGLKNVFRLLEYPQITISDNDPYAVNGSCRVERVNGTQLRPGMTAYVGTVPNMSSYVLIDSVSFDEMSPDPVSVSFRTPTKDPEKDRIRQIPIGQKYQQTETPTLDGNLRVTPLKRTANENRAATRRRKESAGWPGAGEIIDSRIMDAPTEAAPYKYPSMDKANVTYAFPLLQSYESMTSVRDFPSTNDVDPRIAIGDINLWQLPIVPRTDGRLSLPPHIMDSYIHIFEHSSVPGQKLAIILPRVFTENGQAVLKTSAQVLSRYNTRGGYGGTAKHFGVFKGATSYAAAANARDYLILLSIQQSKFVLPKRFPSVKNEDDITNVPGHSDSSWA